MGVGLFIACGGNGEAGGAGLAPPSPSADAPAASIPPAVGPSSAPSIAPSTPSTGPITIPADAVYAVQVQGHAGGLSSYAPFVLPAEVFLAPPIDPANANKNGPNPVDFAILTSASAANGALQFATNTSLSSIRNGQPGPNALDVAFVTMNGNAGHLEAVLDRDVLALPAAHSGAFNVFGVASGGIEEIAAGAVTVRVVDGSSQSISGTIQLGGSTGSQYSATFSGTRIR